MAKSRAFTFFRILVLAAIAAMPPILTAVPFGRWVQSGIFSYGAGGVYYTTEIIGGADSWAWSPSGAQSYVGFSEVSGSNTLWGSTLSPTDDWCSYYSLPIIYEASVEYYSDQIYNDTQPSDSDAAEWTGAHEMGHVLGFDDDSSGIMDPGGWWTNSPSPRGSSGLTSSLYGHTCYS